MSPSAGFFGSDSSDQEYAYTDIMKVEGDAGLVERSAVRGVALFGFEAGRWAANEGDAPVIVHLDQVQTTSRMPVAPSTEMLCMPSSRLQQRP